MIDPDRVPMWTRWVKERGFKRVALITENTDYGVGLVEETKKAFAALLPGVELKTIIFDRAVVDLTPQLLEIKNWKPDVLLNGGVGTPVYLIIKQAYDVGLYPAVPMLISYDAPVRPEYWKTLGDKGNGVSFIVYYHPTMKLPPAATPSGRGTSSSSRRSRSTGPSTPTRRSRWWPTRINAAKSEKADDLVKALLNNKFEGWNATVSFSRGEGPYWQQWTPPDAGHPVHQAGDGVHRGQDHLSAGVQDGRLDAAPSAEATSAPLVDPRVLVSQYVLAGVVIGVIYSLMALGITFIYSIMKMINWAMGEFFMIGSYVQYALIVTVLGPDRWWLALPLAMGSVFLLGLVIQRVLLRPMYVGGHRAARRVRDDHHHRPHDLLPQPRHRRWAGPTSTRPPTTHARSCSARCRSPAIASWPWWGRSCCSGSSSW